MSTSRILIVDDEVAIRKILRIHLSNHQLNNQSFEVSEAASGTEGLEKAAEFHPHLIILDLGLPDMNGIDFLRTLRRWTNVPVVVLTVTDDQSTKVALLDAGADDYLTKPFGTPELLARIRVSLRHHNAEEATPVFKSGDLEVNINSREVRRGDELLKLTGTEYELLIALVRHQGKVVSQAQLLTQIWGRTSIDQTHYLRIYVAQLRKKIEIDSSHPVHILTEPGIGYRIV